MSFQITLYLYILLILSGLLLIIVTFFIKNSWVQRRAEIKVDRFGLDLCVENRALFILLGFLLLVFAGYFLYKYDQGVYNKAVEAEKRFNFTADRLRSLIEKTYDMQINLDFDKVNAEFLASTPNFFNNVDLNVTYCPHDDKSIVLTQDMLRNGTGRFRLDWHTYGILLNIKGIRKDDKLIITAKNGADEWRGEIVFPKVHFKLIKMISGNGG